MRCIDEHEAFLHAAAAHAIGDAVGDVQEGHFARNVERDVVGKGFHRTVLRCLAANCHGNHLLIEVDSGGANDHRKWEWKIALQRLADEFGLIVAVTHYPPGASKWNPIDNRMFSLISANWAGEPLSSYETILKYIRTTHSQKGFHC